MSISSFKTLSPGRTGRAAAPHERQHGRRGFLFAVPALVLFGLFAIYPIVQVFVLSFFDYNLTSPAVFVGLDNYTFLSSDPRFIDALSQTVFYAVGTYLPALLIGLLLAQALSTRIRGMGIVRLLYFLPLAMSWVAASIIWRVVLHPDGMLNQVLGIDVNWLTSSDTAKWGLVIMSIWKETGFFLILFMAGLSSIPDDVYEAARIDGAGYWRRFWYVTLPLLRPITAVCAMMAILRGFQSFSPQTVLTGGKFGTEVVNLFVYKTAFESARMGRASAVAVMMFLLLLTFALVQLRLSRRKD
jgi:ABC-type sugar transport system permease subunit